MPRNGIALCSHARADGSGETALFEKLRGREVADPWKHDFGSAIHNVGIGGDLEISAHCMQRLDDRSQIAGAVVDDRYLHVVAALIEDPSCSEARRQAVCRANRQLAAPARMP